MKSAFVLAVCALAGFSSMAIERGPDNTEVGPRGEHSPLKWLGEPKVEEYAEKAKRAGCTVKVEIVDEYWSEVNLSLVAKDGAPIYRWMGH